jgi:hypothetical protein
MWDLSASQHKKQNLMERFNVAVWSSVKVLLMWLGIAKLP